jgi:hypothetical protein
MAILVGLLFITFLDMTHDDIVESFFLSRAKLVKIWKDGMSKQSKVLGQGEEEAVVLEFSLGPDTHSRLPSPSSIPLLDLLHCSLF